MAVWFGWGLIGWGVLTAGSFCSGAAQGPASDGAGGRALEKHGKSQSAAILREIRDPATGAVWQIVGDGASPGGPGRMRLALRGNGYRDPLEKDQHRTAVIRAGQRIVVEEHTPRAEARLEAVALSAASAGSALAVRLKIGGKVVRAVAIAPGRAVLVEPGEAQP